VRPGGPESVSTKSPSLTRTPRAVVSCHPRRPHRNRGSRVPLDPGPPQAGRRQAVAPTCTCWPATPESAKPPPTGTCTKRSTSSPPRHPTYPTSWRTAGRPVVLRRPGRHPDRVDPLKREIGCGARPVVIGKRHHAGDRPDRVPGVDLTGQTRLHPRHHLRPSARPTRALPGRRSRSANPDRQGLHRRRDHAPREYRKFTVFLNLHDTPGR
jgi:hypothetical protein